MNTLRKVLWISCVGEKGGAEVYMLNLLRGLDRTEFQAGVAMLRPGPLEKELETEGIRTHVFPAHRMRRVDRVLVTIWKLSRLIREQGFDLVHSNGFRAHVYGGLAALLARVPEVWTTHTAEKNGISTSLILRIPTVRVLANCPKTAGYFIQAGLPTTMIWPGVDPEHLSRRTPRKELCHRFSIPSGARWVLMGARFQRYKGHSHFLRALASLPREHADVHGVITGSPMFGMETELVDELKQEVESLGLSGRVHFTGFVPDEDLFGLVAASEVVVHPAMEEDFGLIVAEAQMLGRPVLAYASAGPSEILIDGKTGVLVPVGDERQLSSRLAGLLGAGAMIETMGVAGRERCTRLFSSGESTRLLERVYRCCPERTAPGRIPRKALA